MKFKIDENLHLDCAVLLRNEGFDAMTVRDQNLCGTSDSRLIHICRDENRIFITSDVGLGNVREYPPGSFSGIVVLRLKRLDRESQLNLLKKLIPHLKSKSPEKELWIVQSDKIRIRR